ncbi:hypothetical protein [Protaetiibacter mangrovi]|uniref:Uncharacterized protein n=1 Tax=Protaetiibacter mangrovi TaxID=2970926 RepID=A0ABT1ZDU4_9MICO|nr:hypothetical protein [Protaetiibacter mangrovi]MCS0498860.1 hypothetical protein [Protaetiibacter mangrovi]TPX04207.1 hypothetical protein FJ656_13085 [Schumannella luteola]
MSDLWRELPLFGRPRVDESGVPDGWEGDVAAVREAAAAALARHPDEAAAAAFEAALRPAPPRRDGRPRRVKLAELDRAVYAYLDLCTRLGAPPAVPERAGGAVALARATTAPTEIRAVVSGHALRATDADWSFGRGPVLEDTAAALLEFLGGRSLRAPHPAEPPR